jgi:hypothetical protein
MTDEADVSTRQPTERRMTDQRQQRSLHTEHTFDETMSRMTDVITFRAPSGEGKESLEGVAKAQGELVSVFVRSATVQR